MVLGFKHIQRLFLYTNILSLLFVKLWMKANTHTAVLNELYSVYDSNIMLPCSWAVYVMHKRTEGLTHRRQKPGLRNEKRVNYTGLSTGSTHKQHSHTKHRELF